MNAGAQMQAKVDPFDTPEKKIKELRNQRTNRLFVIRQDFIDALVQEHDLALLTIQDLKDEITELNAREVIGE